MVDAAGGHELVQKKTDEWVKALIELNHLNTLVNFKSPKTASLELVDCPPRALAALLKGDKMPLRSLFDSDERHKDACARARSIHRKIVTFREEQGIEVARLAYGLVTTTKPRSSGSRTVTPLRAPLLLRPVAVHPRTVNETDFTVEVGVGIELNPVLLHALNREHGVTLGEEQIDALEYKINELADELVDGDELIRQAFSILVNHAEAYHVGLELDPVMVMGLFNYQKMPMVRDIESATDLLAAHRLILALAGDRNVAAEVKVSSEAFCPPEPDAIKPDDEYPIHDADSSQQAVIDTVMAGHDLVVEGPPGTGKSQTICNIIAAASARGWRVLFVAEKQAAIKAVTDRLADVGLQDLVLDLHKSTSNKKHIAQQLSESLTRLAQEPPVETADLHRALVHRRARLTDYANAVNEKREPWGLSAFDVQDRLLALGDEYRIDQVLRGPTLRALDARTTPQVEEDLRTFIEQGGLRILRRESPWWRADLTDEDELRAVDAQLDELAGGAVREGSEQMRVLLTQVGLPVPGDFADWQDLLTLLDGVAHSVEMFGGGVFAEELEDVHAATAPRAERATLACKLGWWRRRTLIKQARQMCTTGVRQVAVLHRAFTEALRQREAWQRLAGTQAVPATANGLEEMVKTHGRLRTQLAAVALSARLDDLAAQPSDELTATLDELRADRAMLYKLPTLTALRRRLAGMGLTPLLDELAVRDASPEQARQMFWHTWLRGLANEFLITDSRLRDFTPDQHDRFVREFQEADREHRLRSAQRVRRQVAVALRKARDNFPEQTRILQREASKTRRLMPLRKLVEQTPEVLLALRPCWAMSPLVVSQTLPAATLFDLVIFDEASQVKPQDAITSIMRGKRLVVTGDEKQLPPTAFFDRQLGESGDEDEDELDLGDYESILGALRSVLSNRRLRWHYRSRDERLIAFSNVQIYGRGLVTFPGTRQENPLRLEIVEGTASPGQGGMPAEEVHRVVELVFNHAEKHPELSLGVITLSTRHQDRLDQAIRAARADRQDLDGFFAEDVGPNQRFFVKNIESVQGDERDVIILSLGVPRNSNGSVSRKGFGVLNQEVGVRRLNVAVTRSRQWMTVVSSFAPTALEPSDRVNGTEMLRRFLEMLAGGLDPRDIGGATARPLNGFEEDIVRTLTDTGLTVYPQWGVSEYTIDLAVAHPDRPGELVLAVEADGDRYHRAKAARDRDRLRQEHLERLGWRFHRVWASAWFNDRETESRKIVDAWQKAVQHSEARVAEVAPAIVSSTSPSAPEPADRRGPPHHVPPGFPIDKYTEGQLIAVCRWLISDGLALDRETRLHQAKAELGFRNLGRKIRERLTRAVDIAQHQADQAEG